MALKPILDKYDGEKESLKVYDCLMKSTVTPLEESSVEGRIMLEEYMEKLGQAEALPHAIKHLEFISQNVEVCIAALVSSIVLLLR